jgi:hypothetical protein
MNKRKCFKVLSRTAWLIFHFSGLRFIWQKISPPGGHSIYEKPPSTFVLWLVSAYVAFFGIASIRYENRIDKIENRAHSIYTQLSTPAYKKALSRIPRVQNMQCPYNPTILDPLSVFRSLFSKECKYFEIVGLLKETVEDWKDSLDSAILEGVNLQEAHLDEANFQEAILDGANLQRAWLFGANFQEAHLARANLQRAWLIKANLQGAFVAKANLQGAELLGANLQGADFWQANLQRAWLKKANLQEAMFLKANLQGADFDGANLQEAMFMKADLQGARNLPIEQLCKVKTLYGAKLDAELEKQMRKDYPHLFQTSKEREMGK